MVGEDPGDLIESNMIGNLNDPVEYDDVSWIKPGFSAWDRWWSGDYAPDADFAVGMNTATMKYYVDLADANGLGVYDRGLELVWAGIRAGGRRAVTQSGCGYYHTH